jgi:hypothetical protein
MNRQVDANSLEEHTASIINFDDGGYIFFSNTVVLLPTSPVVL